MRRWIIASVVGLAIAASVPATAQLAKEDDGGENEHDRLLTFACAFGDSRGLRQWFAGDDWHLQEMVARDGIEPPTRGFSVRCSTN